MGFKERLREEIEYHGFLVKEISAAVGISNSTFLSYIDSRGVLPNVNTAVKIAKYLDVSVEYLVDGDKNSLQTESKKTESLQNKNSSLQSEKKQLTEAFEKLSAHDRELLLKIADSMCSMKQ